MIYYILKTMLRGNTVPKMFQMLLLINLGTANYYNTASLLGTLVYEVRRTFDIASTNVHNANIKHYLLCLQTKILCTVFTTLQFKWNTIL